VRGFIEIKMKIIDWIKSRPNRIKEAFGVLILRIKAAWQWSGEIIEVITGIDRGYGNVKKK